MSGTMRIFAFPVLWAFFAIMHTTAGSLVIDVNPKDITPGLNKELTVNCSFSYNGISNISSIISLIVSRADVNNNQQQQFVELESINIFDPDHVTGLTQVNATVSGHVNANDDTHLSIQWSYPTEDQSGVYKCEAHGMDSTGHPTYISQTALVTSNQLGLDQLINQLSHLQLQLDQQENVTKTQTDVINSLLSLTQNQSAMITMLQSQLNHQNQIVKDQSDLIASWQTTLNVSDLVLARFFDNAFTVSPLYQNRYYLLSKQTWYNADHAETICEAYGGHLAEIDSVEEHIFIKNFMKDAPGVRDVLVSGTDEDHNGIWKSSYNQNVLGYTAWASDEPDDSDRHCIVIYRPDDWQMYDFPCLHTYGNYRFMCEIMMN